MNNAVAERTSYTIQGLNFGENGSVTHDTAFHYAEGDSMIDHQKAWYEEAVKNGYASGELDVTAIIQSNYKRTLTEGQLLAIVNDGELMSAPFGELFPKKIDAYLIQLLEAEYDDLETYILDSESNNHADELKRMRAIQNEIARITFH